MADEKALAILDKGIGTWNQWRQSRGRFGLSGADLAYPAGFPGGRIFLPPKLDLSGVNLSSTESLHQVDFSNVDLSNANLQGANLHSANFRGANLPKADLAAADLRRAILTGANLQEADLRRANLGGVDLSYANLRGAKLSRANLVGAVLVETNFEEADLTGCRVYGISAWNLKLTKAIQADLIITRETEPGITVDNLEVAQFVYLLLTNQKLREVIDTLTTKVVLILGRFTQERLAILEAVRSVLRQHAYVPILFNFEGPENQNVRATVETVARLARFVVVDLTEVKAVDQELQAIVPQIKVPVRPLLLEGTEPPGAVLQTLWSDYPDRLLKIHRYHDLDALLVSFKEKVIDPAEARAKELKLRELEDIFE
jgi:uncharacterized protein YjbI with pentapeptide repeats